MEHKRNSFREMRTLSTREAPDEGARNSSPNRAPNVPQVALETSAHKEKQTLEEQSRAANEVLFKKKKARS